MRMMAGWRSPQEEEALFYNGYGDVPVDQRALAYYRYERIVEDIAVYCQQLLLSTEGGDDRQQSLRYLASNFLPGGVIAIARAQDWALKWGPASQEWRAAQRVG